MRKLYRFLRKIIPFHYLQKLKWLYYTYQRKNIVPLSRDEFRKLLIERLHVRKGVDVFIHSSFQLLKLDFPVSDILSIIQEIIGSEGTILFPTTHFTIRAEDYLKNPESVFNVKRSISVYSMLSELARRDKKAVRSWHPTNSVVALGSYAKEYLEEHHLDIYPNGKKSPYYKLVERKAIVIGLGVPSEFLSFSHCVEDTFDYKFPIQTRMDEVFSSKVVTSGGETIFVKTLAAHPRIKYRDVAAFLKKHIDKNIAEDFTYKGIPFFTVDAYKLYHEMGRLAEKRITIYSEKAFQE